MVDYLGITILLGTFVVLLVLHTPISFALLASAILTSFYLQVPLMSVAVQMVKGIHSFSLLAIPFFILAGEIMGAGGISRRIIEFTNVLVGRVRGGLAQVNILASMFFGGISGSAIADVSSIGALLIPMMVDSGYDEDYSVDVTITSACQGLIIPPSHNMIIFAVSAGGLSVGRLFLGGILPGVLLGAALMVISYVIAVKRGYPKGEKVSFREGLRIAGSAVLGLLTAVIIIGGVIGGIFTATESAAVACLYAFVITFFVYREIPVSRMDEILMSALKTLATVLALLASCNAFGWFLAYLRVPALITSALLGVSSNRIVVLLLINILLLALGTIMDMAPLIMITTPILLPVTQAIGMDPVQFGVMMVLNLAIGLCTPPVGAVLFVGCTIGKISMEKLTRSLIPFYAAMIAVLMLVTFVPQVVLFVPDLLLK
ncbi:MAG: TRAP transporter large permease [Lachnospiraceae bacterium]|jgi:tripartite ATP-independent transporter DctM subunit|nr:TRAP transporter large permease [Lachnospiraceae bacterium]